MYSGSTLHPIQLLDLPVGKKWTKSVHGLETVRLEGSWPPTIQDPPLSQVSLQLYQEKKKRNPDVTSTHFFTAYRKQEIRDW